MQVVKRDGSREPLDLNKFHEMVQAACKGLSSVSASQIEMSSGIQFYDGITTKDIQEILIRSASDLISLENPNYQYAAARLILFSLYKEVYGRLEHIHLIDLINQNVENKVYDFDFKSWYSDDELKILHSYIKFDRDLSFTYAGLRQIYDKYLVQDRISGKLYETPQFMYMMISATYLKIILKKED